jgi:hypothetical protein
MTKISNQYSLTNVLTADVVNGRVGINNGSPAYALDVTGAARVSTSAYFATASGSVGIGNTTTPTATSTFDALILGKSTSSSTALVFTNGGSTVWGFSYANASKITLSSYADLAFETGASASERMRITSGGEMIVGATSQAYTNTQGYVAGFKSLNASQTFISIAIGSQTLGSGGILFGLDSSRGYMLMNENLPLAFYTNATERMRITSGGNVYIGLTSSGSNKFAVSAGGTTSDLYVNSSGGIGSYSFGTGTVYANGGILTMTNPSDRRLKKDIKEISYGLSDILKLQPVSYTWIDDSVNQGMQFGFIAQDVQSVMPDAVKEFGEEKYLGLEKDAIYVTLVAAIQELSADLTSAKQEIELLKAKA